MIEPEMLEQFQMILQAIQQSEERTNAKIQQSEERTNAKIQQSETRLMTYIENTVTKRIESLFDGYQLVHEKQWELEHKTEALKYQIEELQARLKALEDRTA